MIGPMSGLTAGWIWLVFTILYAHAAPAPSPFFQITVVDEQTGRGVPLVELRTTSEARYDTDSNGIIALREPGLMGQEVFFHIKSHGYEFPKEVFGSRGLTLKPTPGGSALIKLKRLNIAERLYRMTGEGIYRDTVLVGQPAPLKQPLLNGQVTGQDTVIATPYRGKIYWFWGDTARLSGPLGNFAASGATSPLPGPGGLDPSRGVDLTYFVDASGFSKPMCPDFGPGLHWIEGVMTLRERDGRERLVARVSSQKGLSPAYAWHLAIFNDAKEIFESKVRWDITDSHDSSHPFRARVNGVEYLYLYPTWRVRADLNALADLNAYEAFTPLVRGTRYKKGETMIDRDASGVIRSGWKAGTARLDGGQWRELISAAKVRPEEAWMQLHDAQTGRPVDYGRGSVFWNDFRRRWVMITSGQAGEIWFAEADTPVGPWAYARQVVAHDRYNFYNPTQHPFLDQAGGRLIYFEGTYSASFSDAREQTPRYEYNQVMYRLDLDDPRLSLPAPVYRLKPKVGKPRYLMREGIESEQAWDQVEEVCFFAMPPGRGGKDQIPIFVSTDELGPVLALDPPPGKKELVKPLCYALPMAPALQDEPGAEMKSASLVPLYEYRREGEDARQYSTEATLTNSLWKRAANPVCRVWRKTTTVLTLDPEAKPVALPMQ